VTADEDAAALGIPGDEVAKPLVLVTGSGRLRAVLSGSERLDMHKGPRAPCRREGIRLATEAELADAYPMFELGAAPPFGGPAGDRTIVDRRGSRSPMRCRSEDRCQAATARTGDCASAASAPSSPRAALPSSGTA